MLNEVLLRLSRRILRCMLIRSVLRWRKLCLTLNIRRRYGVPSAASGWERRVLVMNIGTLSRTR